MTIIFWICWIYDVCIILYLSYALLIACLSGTIHSTGLNKIILFLLLFAGVVWMTISSFLFYDNQCLKTAALLASLPCLYLLRNFLLPIIAYVQGKRMN